MVQTAPKGHMENLYHVYQDGQKSNPIGFVNAKEMQLSSPSGRIHKRLHHKHLQPTNLSAMLKPLTLLVLRESDFSAYPSFAHNSLRASCRRGKKKLGFFLFFFLIIPQKPQLQQIFTTVVCGASPASKIKIPPAET